MKKKRRVRRINDGSCLNVGVNHKGNLVKMGAVKKRTDKDKKRMAQIRSRSEAGGAGG